MLGNWHEDIVKLHDQYGTASRTFLPFSAFFYSNRNCDGVLGLYVRIVPNEVSTTSSSAVRVAYSYTGNPWVKVST